MLPLQPVTETFTIFAKRGIGKTYTAAVLVREMMGAALPVVIINPDGVWRGCAAPADGTAAGLPVVIFGGDYAGLPLAETAGMLLADPVVDERVSAGEPVRTMDAERPSTASSRRAPNDRRLCSRPW